MAVTHHPVQPERQYRSSFRVHHAGRWADAYRGYYVGIGGRNGRYISLSRANNNWNLLSKVNTDIQPGKKYTVIVEAAGDNIFVM